MTGAVIALAAIWAVGQTFRDWSLLTALCFYVPSPVVAGVAAVLAVLARRWSLRRTARFAAALALGGALATAVLDNQWRAPPRPRPDAATLRLVHWNVCDGRFGWDGIIARLPALRADAYVLSEVSGRVDLSRITAALGDGFVARRVDNMAIFARGQVDGVERVQVPRGRGFRAVWRVDGREISLLVVDLPSPPHIKRDPMLRAVNAIVQRHQPDLVVGDFNAPRRSWALSDLPAGYRHAYRAAGAGWSYTWPVPVPVFAIDQCIVGPRVTPIAYELGSTAVSDHRYQVLDFTVAAATPAGKKDRASLETK